MSFLDSQLESFIRASFEISTGKGIPQGSWRTDSNRVASQHRSGSDDVSRTIVGMYIRVWRFATLGYFRVERLSSIE
jgi:hypothetical protein